MPGPSVAETRTRAFARVIGPYVTIATGAIIYRAPTMGQTLMGLYLIYFGWIAALRGDAAEG